MKKTFKIIFNIFLGLIAFLSLIFIITAFPVKGNLQAKVVLSGSMEPKIHTGSIVFIIPAKEYKIQDVITFNDNEVKTPITHRIIDMKMVEGKPFYKVKGDANNSPDPNEVSQSQIIGKAIFSLPLLGYAVDFVRKPIGFVLVIILPATIFIYEESKKVFEEIKLKIKEKKKVGEDNVAKKDE